MKVAFIFLRLLTCSILAEARDGRTVHLVFSSDDHFSVRA